MASTATIRVEMPEMEMGEVGNDVHEYVAEIKVQMSKLNENAHLISFLPIHPTSIVQAYNIKSVFDWLFSHTHTNSPIVAVAQDPEPVHARRDTHNHGQLIVPSGYSIKITVLIFSK